MDNLSGIQYALLEYNGTNNIGDEIQSLAAKRLLPRTDLKIDRDHLNQVHPKKITKLICNGWFTHNPVGFGFDTNLVPLLISFHISPFPGQDGMSLSFADTIRKMQEVRDVLKKFGPVGTRDIETWKFLREVGVESYFSGCLTLTLEPSKRCRNSEIILVDVDPSVAAHVRRISDRNILMVKHQYNQPKRSPSCITHAECALDLYAGAYLVITSRLHAALPCLAMETPVLLVGNHLHDGRFSGLLDLCNHSSIENFLHFEAIQLEQVVPNPARHLGMRAELIDRVRNFIDSDIGGHFEVPSAHQPGVTSIIKYFDDELKLEKRQILALVDDNTRQAASLEAMQAQLQKLSLDAARVQGLENMVAEMTRLSGEQIQELVALKHLHNKLSDQFEVQHKELDLSRGCANAAKEAHSRLLLVRHDEHKAAKAQLLAMENERENLAQKLEESVQALSVSLARVDFLDLRVNDLSVNLQAAYLQLEQLRIHAMTLSAAIEQEKAENTLLKAQKINSEAAHAGAIIQAKSSVLPFFNYFIKYRQHKIAKRLIAASLFEPEFYCSQFSEDFQDVAATPITVALHYLETGFCTGAFPNAFFDSHWYLERYKDVRRSGMNPLLHYHLYGWSEGRDPSSNFQTQYYLSTNEDVQLMGINPLAHYLVYGRKQGRLPAPI